LSEEGDLILSFALPRVRDRKLSTFQTRRTKPYNNKKKTQWVENYRKRRIDRVSRKYDGSQRARRTFWAILSLLRTGNPRLPPPFEQTLTHAKRNSHETLTQNYRRLGLSAKLNHTTGGTERSAATIGAQDASEEHLDDPLAINSKTGSAVKAPEVRIERDEKTGAILKVIETGKSNPLNDPLNDLDLSDTDMPAFNALGHKPKNTHRSADTHVTRQLEELAESGVKRRPRMQSKREEEWIEALVEKYDDDYGKMFRDRKLNIWQQSEGDIKRRVKIWRSRRDGGDAGVLRR
jgi:nucleolar protein 16